MYLTDRDFKRMQLRPGRSRRAGQCIRIYDWHIILGHATRAAPVLPRAQGRRAARDRRPDVSFPQRKRTAPDVLNVALSQCRANDFVAMVVRTTRRHDVKTMAGQRFFHLLGAFGSDEML